MRLKLELNEAAMLDQLVTQLTQLLQDYSQTALDPDPLFASLEIGGSEEPPEDPALARLFPDAYAEPEDAAGYRRVTEQGLVNRKIQDAMRVTSDLGLGAGIATDATTVEVDITSESLPVWARTITALRLAMAARIGLETGDDHERLLAQEATHGTVLVFDWLAAILDSVLAVME
nr:DUF2017 family protein [Leucobacter exalbidus]